MAITDSLMTSDDLLKDPLMPKLFSTYDFNPLCRLGNISPVRSAENPLVWIVTLQYDSEVPKAEDVEDDNPLNAPVKRSSGFHEIMAPLYEDLDGNVPALTNGLSFNPPITVRRSVRVYKFQKNYPTWNSTVEDAYHDKVNSDTFLGKPAGTVYCQITSEEVQRKGYTYGAVNFEFQYDPRGWQPRPVHESLYCLNSLDELVRCKDQDGRDVVYPWPLQANGSQVHPDLVITTPPYVSEVNAIESADFNQLGLA